LDELSSVKAAGDETGLGRQICREAAMDFPGQFECVNFRSEKSDLGTYHMNQLSSGEKLIPRNQADIAQDFFTVSRVWNGSKWIFTEGRNALNPASHADINWGSALSSRAAKNTSEGFTSAKGVFMGTSGVAL
jgi:phage FluMu gp28-like protein